MVKPSLIAGAVLMIAGIVTGAWPAERVSERSRRLIPTRTYERRGPTVFVQGGAERVHNASGQALSVLTLLATDGYWVRARPGYLTRERLRGVKVLVVDRAWEAVGDRRTTTMLSRWIHDGGSVLVLARLEGPEARHQLGAGRVGVIDPSAFDSAGFVARLLDTLHWLDD
jgi:hypothetical protein